MVEFTLKKSEEQAAIISLINAYIPLLDTEYLKETSKELERRISRAEALVMFSPVNGLNKIDLMRKQNNALKSLVNYIGNCKEIDTIKESIQKEEELFKGILL